MREIQLPLTLFGEENEKSFSLEYERKAFFLQDIAGVILPGGGDIAPYYYGQDSCAEGTVEPWVDAMQFAILHRAIQQELPVLGICKEI